MSGWPENLPEGQLPINSSPGQIGSTVNNWWIRARLTNCGGLSQKFNSGIFVKLSVYILSRPSKRQNGLLGCYFCSNWGAHTKAGQAWPGLVLLEESRSCMSLCRSLKQCDWSSEPPIVRRLLATFPLVSVNIGDNVCCPCQPLHLQHRVFNSPGVWLHLREPPLYYYAKKILFIL